MDVGKVTTAWEDEESTGGRPGRGEEGGGGDELDIVRGGKEGTEGRESLGQRGGGDASAGVDQNVQTGHQMSEVMLNF